MPEQPGPEMVNPSQQPDSGAVSEGTPEPSPESKPFFKLPETHGGLEFKSADELAQFLRDKTGLTENFTKAQEKVAQERRALQSELAQSRQDLQSYQRYYQQQAARSQAAAIEANPEDALGTLHMTVDQVNRMTADNAAMRKQIEENNRLLGEMRNEQELAKYQTEFNSALGRNKAITGLLNSEDRGKRAVGEVLVQAVASDWRYGRGRQGWSLDEIIKDTSQNFALYEDALKRSAIQNAMKSAGSAMPSLPGGVGLTPPVTDEELAKADRRIGSDGSPSEKQKLLARRAIDAIRARNIHR